jgi:hypothetical protein
MLLDITKVQYVTEYKLILTFENGERKMVDLKDRLNGPIFESLRDIDKFKLVYVDSNLGTISWPNGADKAPETLYKIGKAID